MHARKRPRLSCATLIRSHGVGWSRRTALSLVRYLRPTPAPVTSNLTTRLTQIERGQRSIRRATIPSLTISSHCHGRRLVGLTRPVSEIGHHASVT